MADVATRSPFAITELSGPHNPLGSNPPGSTKPNIGGAGPGFYEYNDSDTTPFMINPPKGIVKIEGEEWDEEYAHDVFNEPWY